MMKIKKILVLVMCGVLLLTGCSFFETEETFSDEGFSNHEEEPFPEPEYEIVTSYSEKSDPANWGVEWEILQNGNVVEEFARDEEINFAHAAKYYPFEGVSTFRGNNYRNDPAYGTADITEEELEIMWKNPIGSLGEWSGCGWSGQPLIVRWDDETKEIMNIYPDKKKDGLTEVIYATLDGNIYFYDIEDGEPTRDKLNVGMTFKGTGTLDPRGYPIMYIGSGIAAGGRSQRMFAISLIDTTILYEQSGMDSEAFRSWAAFDSSPIIDAETDTLIWPGENGVLYTIKLNTKYEPEKKSISIEPENVVKCRYKTNLTKANRWVGFESSSVVVGRNLYLTENSGMLFCVDLNTMKLNWAQDTLDDSNATSVFDWEEDCRGYLYSAPSLRWTAQGGKGSTTIFKIDAENGEIVWEKTYECARYGDISGGVQSTPISGRKFTDLDGIIIYNIAFSPHSYRGVLVALDKATGDVIWEYTMDDYTWSSPVAIYTPEGKGYIVICDSVGNVKLIDGMSGKFIDSVNIGSNVEASPAVFEDKFVVGTKGGLICGMKIK